MAYSALLLLGLSPPFIERQPNTPRFCHFFLAGFSRNSIKSEERNNFFYPPFGKERAENNKKKICIYVCVCDGRGGGASVGRHVTSLTDAPRHQLRLSNASAISKSDSVNQLIVFFCFFGTEIMIF